MSYFYRCIKKILNFMNVSAQLTISTFKGTIYSYSHLSFNSKWSVYGFVTHWAVIKCLTKHDKVQIITKIFFRHFGVSVRITKIFIYILVAIEYNTNTLWKLLKRINNELIWVGMPKLFYYINTVRRLILSTLIRFLLILCIKFFFTKSYSEGVYTMQFQGWVFFCLYYPDWWITLGNISPK